MTDTATLQARLDEAEAALHDLLTGRQIVQIGAESDRVQYTPAMVPQLRAYISELRGKLNPMRARRALGVRFR
jgi:hypothetical protein